MLAAVLVLSFLAASQAPAVSRDWEPEILHIEPVRSPVAMWTSGVPMPTAAELEARSIGAERRFEERMQQMRGGDDGCSGLSSNLATFEDIVTLSASPDFEVTRVVYIDASASVGGDGSSWQSAYQSIQDALGAEPHDSDLVEFRIAGGIYRADRVNGVNTLDPDLVIDLPGLAFDTIDDENIIGVKSLKGGYAGRGATNPDERDTDLYPTVFTGDLLGDDEPSTFSNYEDNTKVLFVPSETELNGIIIEHARIGAMNVRWMTDCTVRWCFASGDDLDQPVNERSPVIAREARLVGNIFHENRGGSFGGAVLTKGMTVIANSRFLHNQAPVGGAVAALDEFFPSMLLIQNSFFAGNRADSESGGIAGAVFSQRLSGDPRTLQMAHCVFAGNEAVDGAFGAMSSFTARHTVYNSVFDQNFSSQGTGIEAETGSLFNAATSPSTVTVVSNVFQLYNERVESSPWYPRISLNLEAIPGFATLPGPDGLIGTLDDTPRLGSGSVCIDAAISLADLPDGYPREVLTDIADLDGDCVFDEQIPVDFLGNPRVSGNEPDIGCIEYDPSETNDPASDWTYLDPRITDLSTDPIRLYVDANSAGGDGSSWQSAFSNPSEALAVASSRLGPVEIWVAAGEYSPLVTRSGIDSFRLSENVTLLGGFNGTESEADQRDPDANETVLTGDTLGNDDLEDYKTFLDNARQVVISIGQRGGGVIDGFTVRSGSPRTRFIGPYFFLYDEISAQNSAGLLYVGSGTVEVRNCRFGPDLAGLRNEELVNASSISMHGHTTNLVMANCDIDVSPNELGFPGSISYALRMNAPRVAVRPRDGYGEIHGSQIRLTNPAGSRVLTMLADYANAVHLDRVTMTSVDALRLNANFAGDVRISNSILQSSDLVVMFMRSADALFSNCTFQGRGTLFLSPTPPTESASLYLRNSVVAGEGLALPNPNSTNVSVSGLTALVIGVNENVLNLLDETSQIFDFEDNAAAFFIDPLGPDGESYTGDEDLRLAPGSPAINTGLNEFVTSDFDLDGNPRIIASVVDRGAYEFTGTCTGDVNGDGAIDLDDLNAVLTRFGQPVPFGDANGSGTVDLDDLSIVLALFGQECPD